MLIAQLTDLHICATGRPAARVVETNMLAERAFRTLATLRPVPDLLVISGDIAENGLDEEYGNFVQLLERYVRMPVYIIPGNHDRRAEFRKALGHLPGVGDHPGFIQYAVDDFPVRLVMLDTVVPGHARGSMDGGRLDFLERTLAAAPDRPTMIVLHHPPFRCGSTSMDIIDLAESDEFAKIVAKHHQVERIVCGHHHRSIVGRVGQAIAIVAPSVAHQWVLDFDPKAPPALVFEPPAFMLHKWDAKAGMASHTVYVEAYPGPYPGLTDPEYPGRPT